jgi:hypothetical protein
VNRRLVLLSSDGSFLGTVDIALAQPRFLAVDSDAIYVLDAEADRRLVCLGWQGEEIGGGSLPALDDVVTGLFVADGRACLEVAHDGVFLVELKGGAKESGTAERAAPAALRALAGRPIDHDLGREAKVTFKPEQGLQLKRFKVDKKTLKAVQAQGSAPSFPQGQEIDHLVSADGDGGGGLIIGARLLCPTDAPEDSPAMVIGRLPYADEPAGDATLTDTVTLRDSPFAYFGQPYAVAPDGRILQPVGSEAGYTILVHRLPHAGTVEEVQP